MGAWIALTLLVIAGLALLLRADAGSIAGFDPSDFAIAVACVALVIFLASSIAGSYRGRAGHAVRDVLTWTLVALLLVAGYSYREEIFSLGHRVAAFHVGPGKEEEAGSFANGIVHGRQHGRLVRNLAEADLAQGQRDMRDRRPDEHGDSASDPGNCNSHCRLSREDRANIGDNVDILQLHQLERRRDQQPHRPRFVQPVSRQNCPPRKTLPNFVMAGPLSRPSMNIALAMVLLDGQPRSPRLAASRGRDRWVHEEVRLKAACLVRALRERGCGVYGARFLKRCSWMAGTTARP